MITIRQITMLCSLIGIAGCAPSERSAQRPTLNLYVAASLNKVIQEVSDAFEAETNCTVRLNSASSGALANQLLSAPRADIFISANTTWIDKLDNAETLLPNSRQVIASNRLVLVGSNSFASGALTGPAILCQGTYKYIAIGAPEFVPAGSYAKAWLENMNCPISGDLWKHVKQKVIRAPDASAVIGYVRHSEDTLGLVYYTDYLTVKNDLNALYLIPTDRNAPIIYSAAIIETSEHVELANEFLDFTKSDAGLAILDKYGFLPPETVNSL